MISVDEKPSIPSPALPRQQVLELEFHHQPRAPANRQVLQPQAPIHFVLRKPRQRQNIAFHSLPRIQQRRPARQRGDRVQIH
jgi:hypothetical protein